MSSSLVMLVIAAVFIGALMRASFGFGEAVVSMPLLALLPINLHTSISLIGLAGLTVAIFTIKSNWHHVERPIILRLGLSTILGIPAGLFLVTYAPKRIIMLALGSFLMVYGVCSLRTPFLTKPSQNALLLQPSWAYPFGFCAGMLGSAYNFNGVPVVVYGTLRKLEPERFRATLQAHFLISGLLVVCGQALGGLWTKELLLLYGFSLPVIVLATLLGVFIHRRLPNQKFERYVFILIILLGALLVF